MKIGVLVKTVNYIYAQTGMDLSNNYVGSNDVVQLLNPLDEAALEFALRLKDSDPDNMIMVVSCGDDMAKSGLRHGLAMGADQAVLIRCQDVNDFDATSLATTLYPAFQHFDFDLILCGATAIDSDDRLEAPCLAGLLGIPHATDIVAITQVAEGDLLSIERIVERGDRYLLECQLPALLTIGKSVLTPRYPSLAGFLRSETATINVISPAEFGQDDAVNPDRENLTQTVSVSRPKPKRRTGVRDTFHPVPDRINFMVNGNQADQKSDGRFVTAESPELLTRLNTILHDAGVLSS